MKINDDKKRLSLNSPYFDKMRLDLDAAIHSAVNAMLCKEINSGTVALKLDIALIPQSIPDNNAPTGIRSAVPIKIGYKVAVTLQSKAELKGDVVKDLKHELVQDDTKAFFILNSDEASGQLNMFNGYDELPQGDGSDDDDELPGDDEEDTEE